MPQRRIGAQKQHAMHVTCAQHALNIHLTGLYHVLQVHPDLFQDPDARATNERSFKLLQEYLAAGLLHPVLWACSLHPHLSAASTQPQQPRLIALNVCCHPAALQGATGHVVSVGFTIDTLVHCPACSLLHPSALPACRLGKCSCISAFTLTATLLHCQPQLATPVLLPCSRQR